MVAPLLDYMPGVRKGNRRRPAAQASGAWRSIARSPSGCGREGYGQALVMPRTWKSALAPFLAGIPRAHRLRRRSPLRSDQRPALRRAPAAAHDRPLRDARLAARAKRAPAEWPLPELEVPPSELAAWRRRLGLAPDGRPVVALAPGAVGPSKRWPGAYYAELARRLAAEGNRIWVIGGPGEQELAAEIVRAGRADIRDLTGPDLRNAILALAAADAAVSNDSGLLHVAAALGTPAIGIFGPTSPWHWAPLNPIAAVIETASELPCRPCHKPVCRLGHHRCMRDISVDRVASAIRRRTARLRRRAPDSHRSPTCGRRHIYSSRSSALITSAHRRQLVLAADDRDRSLPHRPGEARLAADEDRDQRHAERRGEMEEPGIDADDERCARDERAPCGRAVAARARGRSAAPRRCARCARARPRCPMAAPARCRARRAPGRARSTMPPAILFRAARWRAAGCRRRPRSVPRAHSRDKPEIDRAIGRVAEREAGQHAIARDGMQVARDADAARRRTTTRRARGRCPRRNRGGGRARAAQSAPSGRRPWVSMTSS